VVESGDEDERDQARDSAPTSQSSVGGARVVESRVTAMAWTPFGSGGPRRCSFCGRREDSAGHLVHARGAYICERCVAEASNAIASHPSQSLVRIKPHPHLPADRSAAEEAIERAFETVFNPATTVSERCAAIEDGVNLEPAMQQVRERVPASNRMDLSVEYVRFLGDDEAEVHFVMFFPGGSPMPRLAETGHAVLTRDGWKVSRDTWCGLVGRIGVQCPPPPTD
jgi:hypothetical protein